MPKRKPVVPLFAKQLMELSIRRVQVELRCNQVKGSKDCRDTPRAGVNFSDVWQVCDDKRERKKKNGQEVRQMGSEQGLDFMRAAERMCG